MSAKKQALPMALVSAVDRVIEYTSMVIAVAPISIMVACAFLTFGFLNAGTPFAIASIPVNAAEPEAKARSSSSVMAI